jgi:hypothetical protein
VGRVIRLAAVLFLAIALALDITGAGHSFPFRGRRPRPAAGGCGHSLQEARHGN